MIFDAKEPRNRWTPTHVFLLAVCVFVIWIAPKLAPASSKKPAATVAVAAPVEEEVVDDSFHACRVAQRYIQDALKAPATAEFPSCGRQSQLASTELVSKGTYKATTYVDAQNSFGATLRGYYDCAVYIDGYHEKVTCLQTDADHATVRQVF